MGARYAVLLGHDALDQWPPPSRVFEKPWDARTELHRILAAQPGAVGIVSRWDETSDAWMGTPFHPGETARAWWEHVTHEPLPEAAIAQQAFDFGGAA